MAACGTGPEGYMAWHADADRRHKAGERQVRCLICVRWVWPAHVCEEHKSYTRTAKEWATAMRKTKRKASP